MYGEDMETVEPCSGTHVSNRSGAVGWSTAAMSTDTSKADGEKKVGDKQSTKNNNSDIFNNKYDVKYSHLFNGPFYVYIQHIWLKYWRNVHPMAIG